MATKNESIEELVKKIIDKQLGAYNKTITHELSFENDLGADSLDLAELVMEFEDTFDMNISDEDAEKLHTVGDAVNYIIERTQQKSV